MIQQLKVLIMEDNEDDCLLLLRELNKGVTDLSYESIGSREELEETLDRSVNFDFDIILSDYNMGAFTAMDALEVLSKKGKKGTPFILVSGAIGEEIAVSAMRNGARDFINKSKYDRLIPVIERELAEVKKNKEIEKNHKALVQNELQFRALYKLSKMEDYPLPDVEAFVVKELTKLTKSSIGYLAYSKDKNSSEFEIKNDSFIISTDDGNSFQRLSDKNLTINTKENFILKNVVEDKTYFICNSRLKKEQLFVFEKQIKINKFIAVPFIKDETNVKMVLLVGNKSSDYTLRDLEQIQLFLDTIVKIRQKKLYEKHITDSLKEKEILLREIHHRVKNNLQIISSLLNLQSKSMEDKTYSNIFKESRDRIKTMSLVHEKLYKSDDLGCINFKGYVRSIVTNLFHSYNTRNNAIKLEIDVEDFYISIDLAIPCGLIINEIVSNSLKYAFPDGKGGAIRVIASKNSNGEYKMEVSDTGVGFDVNQAKGKSSSLGLKLINALVNQIEGELSINTEKDTVFHITFSE